MPDGDSILCPGGYPLQGEGITQQQGYDMIAAAAWAAQRRKLTYQWFKNLGFDFEQVYPEAGDIERLDRQICQLADTHAKESRSDGTTFKQYELEIHRRLFALAKDDPEARAVLARLIAYADGKNHVAALG